MLIYEREREFFDLCEAVHYVAIKVVLIINDDLSSKYSWKK